MHLRKYISRAPVMLTVSMKFICVQHEQTINLSPHPMPLPHCYDTLHDTRFYLIRIVKNVRNECDICHILGFDIDIC